MTKAPLSLWLIAITYIALEVWTFSQGPSLAVATRTAISLVLFYFLLRGSRAAGYILALCMAGAALICFYAVVVFSAPASIIFGVAGVVLSGLASYVIFSPTVRAFQASAVAQPPSSA
jgi:hypothetical protein